MVVFKSFQNVSSQAWTGNPREYTIGGVLSGLADIEHYFRQVLSVSDSVRAESRN